MSNSDVRRTKCRQTIWKSKLSRMLRISNCNRCRMRLSICHLMRVRLGGCATSKVFHSMSLRVGSVLLQLPSGFDAAEPRARCELRWNEDLTMNEIDVPASLLSQVRAGLEPVTPLASPSRRLLALVPLALILFLGPPMFWGWRINLELLPSWTSWGLSALESLAGVALM